MNGFNEELSPRAKADDSKLDHVRPPVHGTLARRRGAGQTGGLGAKAYRANAEIARLSESRPGLRGPGMTNSHRAAASSGASRAHALEVLAAQGVEHDGPVRRDVAERIRRRKKPISPTMLFRRDAAVRAGAPIADLDFDRQRSARDEIDGIGRIALRVKNARPLDVDAFKVRHHALGVAGGIDLAQQPFWKMSALVATASPARNFLLAPFKGFIAGVEDPVRRLPAGEAFTQKKLRASRRHAAVDDAHAARSAKFLSLMRLITAEESGPVTPEKSSSRQLHEQGGFALTSARILSNTRSDEPKKM